VDAAEGSISDGGARFVVCSVGSPVGPDGAADVSLIDASLGLGARKTPDDCTSGYAHGSSRLTSRAGCAGGGTAGVATPGPLGAAINGPTAAWTAVSTSIDRL